MHPLSHYTFIITHDLLLVKRIFREFSLKQKSDPNGSLFDLRPAQLPHFSLSAKANSSGSISVFLSLSRIRYGLPVFLPIRCAIFKHFRG